MAKGIIYIMDTIVSGLIKIGKTRIDQFDTRMKFLENNGYKNVTGLQRSFAIEVDAYDEKEKLIHEIFSKSRVANTELFALDIEVVILLLSSLDGKQIYPSDKTKKAVFNAATVEFEVRADNGFLPDGEYFLQRKVKGFGEVKGLAIVEDGVFKVKKGSYCAPTGKGYVHEIRSRAKIVNNILQEDIICLNPSSAGWVVIGKANNGWCEWKDKMGNKIADYRKI